MAMHWEGKVSVKLGMCLFGPVTIKRMFMNEIAPHMALCTGEGKQFGEVKGGKCFNFLLCQ